MIVIALAALCAVGAMAFGVSAPANAATISPSTTTPSASAPNILEPRVPTGNLIAHAASCVNNDCPTSGAHLSDSGGQLVLDPKVYVVLFSSSASSLSPNTGFVPGVTDTGGAGTMPDAINTILDSSYSSWWQEYARPSRGQLFQPGSYGGTVDLVVPFLTTASSVDDGAIQSALSAAQQSGVLPAPGVNNIYAVFLRNGQLSTINSQGENSYNNYCAYHTDMPTASGQRLYYSVFPNESAYTGCDFVGTGASAFDNLTPLVGHELAETVTDPSTPRALVDTPLGGNGEIGDLCEHGASVAGTTTAASGYDYYLQYEFSNASGTCIENKANVSLTATSVASPTTTVTAVLTSSGNPVGSATLSLVSGTGIVATATTSASGTATFTLPSTPIEGLRAFYAGDATYSGIVASPSIATTPPPVTTPPPPPVTTPPPPASGYRLATASGNAVCFGSACFGGVPGAPNRPIVGMARTPDNAGYWMVASDGGVFSFGDAGFYGSTGAMKLNRPIVGMAATPDGKGYWLVASDGGIFSFGDAQFHGSTGAMILNRPVVGMAASPDGKGYWLVATDGGIFAFGDAGFHGSTGNITLNKPVVGMTATHSGGGYWMVASDGGIFSFGDAGFHGSAASARPASPVVGMLATSSGGGYWVATAGGQVFAFGDALGYGGSDAFGTSVVAIS